MKEWLERWICGWLEAIEERHWNCLDTWVLLSYHPCMLQDVYQYVNSRARDLKISKLLNLALEKFYLHGGSCPSYRHNK